MTAKPAAELPVALTHPDRVLWPAAGITKQGLAEFYAELWPWISPHIVNRPLSRLARAAQVLSRGETPAPLPEQGPLEIRDLNASFNRMAKDLRQAEADRELMLAGISHDLRTPLARMRLEIELSGVSEDARQAIDEDLGQIDHSIGQLMEYARPAGTLPQLATDISAVLAELYDALARHRTGIKLLDRCALDYPELAKVWSRGGREGALGLLARYLDDRARRGRLRRFEDGEVLARIVLETLVFWAVHRHWDPSPQAIDEATARRTVLGFLTSALVKE